MFLKFLSFLMVVLFLGGCTGYQDPDFNKPLIVLPQDTDAPKNKDTNPESNDAKPPQQQAWVEAKTSRLWVSPHVDENGDYVEGYYKYLVLDPGHWSLNGNETKQQ